MSQTGRWREIEHFNIIDIMLLFFIGVLIGAVIALVAYIIIQRMVLKGQKNEIIAKAEIEAEGIKKDKIHQALSLIHI